MPEAIQDPALAALPGVRHGFFTRSGGVSDGLYGALNCGFGSGDDRAAVTENRRRVAAALGLSPENLLSVHQYHSEVAILAAKPWREPDKPKADAMVSSAPGLGLGILTADCAPVLLADPQARLVAAAHAGWRGALDGVLDRTLALMRQQGARPERIVAAVGPCIAQPSYEVGPELREAFVAADAAHGAFFRDAPHQGRFLFDLPGFATARLRALGVGTVAWVGQDTYGAPEHFFSYRRATHRGETDYGRLIAVIALDPARP